MTRPPAARARRRMRMGVSQRVVLVSLALVLVSAAISSLIAYGAAKRDLEEALGRELLAVVNAAAPAIDGDLHQVIYRASDGSIEGADEFEDLRATLVAVRDSVGLAARGSPLYTMRITPDFARTGELEFVVMTDPGPDGAFFVGHHYAAQPHNRAALGGRPARSGIYEDSEGTWISAAAPLRDSGGDIVGLVQADRRVEFYYAQARRRALELLGGGALAVLVGAILAVWLCRSLLVPLAELRKASEAIGRGRLAERIVAGRDDEFGDLARTFNWMAGTIEQAQHRLVEALETAQQAERTKGRFLASMSHELRTPLNAIIGYCELTEETLRQRGDHELAEDQRRIIGAGRHLLALVNDLLDLSKLEAGKLEISVERTRLMTLVERSLRLVRPQADQKHVALVPPDAIDACWVVVDGRRVVQVLVNLLGNAVKFTRGGGRVGISIVRDAEGGSLAITVWDTGVGIDPSQLDRLFHPFVQLDNQPAGCYQGTGLGLVLSRNLIELHGGTLDATSVPGEGSRFTITLPWRLGPARPAERGDLAA